MKNLGLLLIAIGFLGGALVAVLDVASVSWPAYATALAVGALGLVAYRRSVGASAGDHEQVHGNLRELRESLDNLCSGLESLAGRRDALPPHEYRFEIDRLFRDDLNRFAAAREAMQHAFGLQVYADIMSAFAAGERYLNRVWTASADGYVDEASAYIERARVQFREARDAFLRHHGDVGVAGAR